MENVVVRTGTEAQELIRDFIIDVNKGMKAAMDAGCPEMSLPTKCSLTFTFIGELSAATLSKTQVTPESTETQTTVQPEIISTSTQTRGATTTTTTPAGQETTTRQGGGDRSETNNEHELL